MRTHSLLLCQDSNSYQGTYASSSSLRSSDHFVSLKGNWAHGAYIGSTPNSESWGAVTWPRVG